MRHWAGFKWSWSQLHIAKDEIERLAWWHPNWHHHKNHIAQIWGTRIPWCQIWNWWAIARNTYFADPIECYDDVRISPTMTNPNNRSLRFCTNLNTQTNVVMLRATQSRLQTEKEKLCELPGTISQTERATQQTTRKQKQSMRIRSKCFTICYEITIAMTSSPRSYST